MVADDEGALGKLFGQFPVMFQAEQDPHQDVRECSDHDGSGRTDPDFGRDGRAKLQGTSIDGEGEGLVVVASHDIQSDARPQADSFQKLEQLAVPFKDARDRDTRGQRFGAASILAAPLLRSVQTQLITVRARCAAPSFFRRSSKSADTACSVVPPVMNLNLHPEISVIRSIR
jgi:hypothetical protein